MDWLEPYKDINNLKAMSVGELNTLSLKLINIIISTKKKPRVVGAGARCSDED